MKPQPMKSQNPKKQKKPAKPYFYGIHAVKALLDYRPCEALTVFIQPLDNNKNLDDIAMLAKSLGISVQTINKDKLTELCVARPNIKAWRCCLACLSWLMKHCWMN